VAVELQRQHSRPQSLWLDNISRSMLEDASLPRLIESGTISGLTSNPSIFEAAISQSKSYDPGIYAKARNLKSSEAIFIELALEDLCAAADLFRAQFEATQHLDGWVSMEISPLLAHDGSASIAAAERIYVQAGRANLFVKIPGTPAGISAIEALIYAGIPINVTLLFSRAQYLAASDAYLRGIERRIAAGLGANVASVASIFVSRWDKAVNARFSDRPELQNHLGIAVAGDIYAAYSEVLASERWQALSAQGARVQRLLWASTGTKDPAASATLYVDALAVPDTINTLPEKTLQAHLNSASHERAQITLGDGSEAKLLSDFAQAGVDVSRMAKQLQADGCQAFVSAWQGVLACIEERLHDARSQ
jgi:transaldolase